MRIYKTSNENENEDRMRNLNKVDNYAFSNTSSRHLIDQTCDTLAHTVAYYSTHISVPPNEEKYDGIGPCNEPKEGNRW